LTPLAARNKLVAMGYQFIHVESYARHAGAGKAGGNTVDKVLAEAKREQGACPHVAEPQKPRLLYGESLDKVAARAEAWAAQATDLRGHKLRKDGLCLLAGVVSLPRHDEERWKDYKNASLSWLVAEYGDRLRAVVEHQDEPNPHLHFYVVPRDGERFAAIHDGRQAAEVLGYETTKGERNQAYREAMQKYQAKFFEKVSAHHGLERFGPRRLRINRATWKARQEDSRAALVKSRTMSNRLLEYLTPEELTELRRRVAVKDKAMAAAKEKERAALAKKAKDRDRDRGR
jgi:hypothetical protein